MFGYSWVLQHLEGAWLSVLLYLLLPLLEDSLGAYDEGGLAMEGLEGGRERKGRREREGGREGER